eukprot:2119256-Rhodomonas_salina.2
MSGVNKGDVVLTKAVCGTRLWAAGRTTTSRAQPPYRRTTSRLVPPFPPGVDPPLLSPSLPLSSSLSPRSES